MFRKYDDDTSRIVSNPIVERKSGVTVTDRVRALGKISGVLTQNLGRGEGRPAPRSSCPRMYPNLTWRPQTPSPCPWWHSLCLHYPLSCDSRIPLPSDSSNNGALAAQPGEQYRTRRPSDSSNNALAAPGPPCRWGNLERACAGACRGTRRLRWSKPDIHLQIGLLIMARSLGDV